MSRTSRTLAAVVLSFALLAAAAPAAHARTLATPHQPNPVIETWLSSALSWIGSFFTPAPQGQPAPRSVQKTGTVPTTPPPVGGIAQPMTGTMIDPSGNCLIGCIGH